MLPAMNGAVVNEHSRWRRALAERYAAGYRQLPGVRAVLLTGSVARGLADRYSDIELMVFWDTAPPERSRSLAAENGGGALVGCCGRSDLSGTPPHPALDQT